MPRIALFFAFALVQPVKTDLVQALSTVEETATFNSYVAEVGARMDNEIGNQKERCCMQSITCKTTVDSLRASMLLYDEDMFRLSHYVKKTEEEISTLLDSVCNDDRLPSAKKTFLSFANEARKRIGRMQVDLAWAMRKAAVTKSKIGLDDYTHLWDWSGCFDCTLRTEHEENVCRIFKKRMTDIESAMQVVINQSALLESSADPSIQLEIEKALSESWHSILSSLYNSKTRLYFNESRRMQIDTEDRRNTVKTCIAVSMFIFLYAWIQMPKSKPKRTLPWFRDGKGKYCDGCCGVCWNEDENILWTTITKCEHSFHAECMDELLNFGTRKCPVCMVNMFSGSLH